MRMKGQFNIVNGEPSLYPNTRDAALEEKIAKYHPRPTPRCPRCGIKSVRYTKTDICAGCAQIDAADSYNSALETLQPTSPAEARQLGLDFYWQPEPGRYCGHIGMTTFGGKCAICAARPDSPRQVALSSGEIWYQPASGDLCRNGHNAPRRVNNGSCQQCEQTRDRYTPVWQSSPDLIISKADAVAFGMSTYRTGKPCRRGHASFRYVASGACLECMGRIK